MKYTLVSAMAVFILSSGAFASTRLSQVKEMTVTTGAELTTWIADNDTSGVASASAGSSNGGSVGCSLAAFNVTLSQFQMSRSERIGDGTRYFISPKAPITLNVESATSEVRSESPTCNGEPEMCDTYDVRYETLILSDAASNEWMMMCKSSNAANPISSCDIGIKGVEAR